MQKKLAWTLLVSCCVACYGNSDGGGSENSGGSAGSGGSTSAGGSAGSAGRSTSGGSAGSVGAGGSAGGASGGSLGQAGSAQGGQAGSTQGGTGGSPPVAGAGGAGDTPCNDLELVEMNTTCAPVTTVHTPTGGQIPDGVYALLPYESTSCVVVLEQTLRITQAGAGTYEVELVIDLADTRANATMVTSGSTLTSTLTCGGDTSTENQYSVFQDAGTDYLRMSNENGVYVYERVAD